MKILKSLSMALLLTLVFVACSKDKNDTPPAFSIEGKWFGKIGAGAAIPSGQYALNIKSGGVVERVNSIGNVTATGT